MAARALRQYEGSDAGWHSFHCRGVHRDASREPAQPDVFLQEVSSGNTPRDSMDFLAQAEQMLRQIASTRASDHGDQGASTHGAVSEGAPPCDSGARRNEMPSHAVKSTSRTLRRS